MKRSCLVALLIHWLLGLTASGQELPGIPAFGDDFSVSGLFAENWEASKATKWEEGRALIPSGNNMTLKRIPDGAFAFTADLVVAKPAGPDSGHCGVILDGIHFMLTPSLTRPTTIANTAYRVPGEERSRGASGGLIAGFEFGKPVRIMVSRVKLGEGHKYCYTVNGRPVDSFIVAMPANGKITFYGYRNGIAVDNFQLCSLQEDASNNLVVNSSFEYLQEGMPNYMKPLTRSKVRFEGKWADFLKAFAIDTTEKASGNQSARMTLEGDFLKAGALPSPCVSNGVGTHNVSVMAKTPVTFSAYLKASEDDFPVSLNLWELWYKNHSKPIKISKQWERYSFTLDNPEKGIVRGNITFGKAGTVWADDLQIEIGREASKYMSSPLDKDKFAGAKVPAVVEADARPAGNQRVSLPKPAAPARPLDLYTRYNYYMNEDSAVLVGTLGLADADKLTGKIRVAGTTLDVKMDSAFAFDIPLKGIENGEHTIALDVYRGAKQLAGGTARLVKRPFQAGATQIDHQRRCLVVDGKPYLVLAPFFGIEPGLAAADQDRVLRNTLRLHKEMGYRCFHVGAKDDPPFPQQTRAFYELCQQEGIKIIHWPFHAYATRDNPQGRFQTQTTSAIIAWMVIDEPELGPTPSEDVEAFLAAHQAASPYTPVFMNNTIVGIPRRFANLKTDVLMLDDYLTNRENRKVAEMIDATDMMMEAGREQRKPVFYFLTAENLQNHYRECTYAEQVAQTYGVIIAGATGVSYFCSLPLYPEDYRACVDANRELLALEGAIFSLEKTSSAAVSDSAVRFMTRRLGEKLFVIALNTDNDRAANVEIRLPLEFTYAANAEVKFEDRKVDVKDRKISDEFKPLERHVYAADIVK
jgi:hypothetical protein